MTRDVGVDRERRSRLTPKVPLVGRGPELRELEDHLARAVTLRQPEVVTLIGPAGVGKSHLVDALLDRLSDRSRKAVIYRGPCHPGGPPYGPIQRILRSRFGLAENLDPETARELFRKGVAETAADRRVTEFVHFLGAFLGLKYPDSPFIKAVDDDAEQLSLISRAVLRRFFELDAQTHPIVLTFEDVQWAPEDTLDILQYLIGTLRDAPILVLVVARPELLARRADWTAVGGDHHHRIELAPLSADDAAQMMTRLLEPLGEPPEALVDAAVDMAGGNPYLLEQVVRTFHRNGILRVAEDGRWVANLGGLEGARLPLSVEDAISARIAALTAPERELLEKASVMGGVFWIGALVALARLQGKTPELWGGHGSTVAHLEDALGRLVDRDYVLELPDSSLPGEREFAFKHNLEREALGRLANRSELRKFHLVVAEWLEFRLSGRVEEHSELLAQHYEEGGAPRRAARYFLTAADRARARYANNKAAEYYGRGIEMLADSDVALRLEALHHYGDVLQIAGRNDEALNSFRAMLDIAFRLDLKAKGGAAHNRIGRLFRALGRLDDAMRHLGTGHALFEAAGDLRGIASSLDDVGKVHWMRGAYSAAETFMRDALSHRERLGDERSIALSYNNLGLVYADSGRFAEAIEAFQAALELRRHIDDKPGIAQSLNNLGTIHQDHGDHDRAIEFYRESLTVARVVGDRMHQAVILTNLGESCYRVGQPDEAIRVLGQADEISATLGDRILEGEVLRGLAKAHMLVHDMQVARDYIRRSIEAFEAARGKPFLGVALRTQAEILAAAGWGGEDHRQAKESFERSLALFKELGNEIEIARTCEGYAAFLSAAPPGEASHHAGEITTLRARAAQIRERLHQSDAASADLPTGDPTLPGDPSPWADEPTDPAIRAPAKGPQPGVGNNRSPAAGGDPNGSVVMGPAPSERLGPASGAADQESGGPATDGTSEEGGSLSSGEGTRPTEDGGQ